MKSVVIVAVAILGLLPAWVAEAVTAQLGDQDLVSGTFHTTGDLTSTAAGDPAGFNTACNADNNVGPSCSRSWTFTYSIPLGETITGATLTLGILDHDSAVAGNQVAGYTLNTTNDLTALLNTQFESFGGADGLFCTGINGPNTVFCSEYDVYTITIPNSAFSSLATGSAVIALSLQGPGHGVLGNTTFNGALLDFSRLDITTSPSTSPVPEPTTMLLLAAGLGAFVVRGFASRARRR